MSNRCRISRATRMRHALEWLALTLTPGLGPTRARSWWNISAPSRPSSAPRSPNWSRRTSGRLGAVAGDRQIRCELAQEEIARAMAAGVIVLVCRTMLPTRLA